MKFLILLISLAPLLSFSQSIFAYRDFNNFFHSFSNGYFMQIEHNAVNDVTFGDQVIAYTNSQRDFKIYDGKATKLITNQVVQFQLSDHLVGWNIGPILYYYEDGQPHNITSFGAEYLVKDSLIVYQETRYNTLNVIYKGKSIQLMQSIELPPMPEAVGDNLVVFRDNGNILKVFYRGEIYEIGAGNSFQAFQFFPGTDILGFNDPNTRTFAVFENGKFIDVEEMQVKKVKAGRGFLIYEDINGNLKYYGKGEQKELSSFFQNWDAKDDVVMWGESNSTFGLKDGERYQICNYKIDDWQLKNDVVAFRTNVGGIAATVNGKFNEITNLQNCDYTINGHGVMVSLTNRQVIILSNGQLFRD